MFCRRHVHSSECCYYIFIFSLNLTHIFKIPDILTEYSKFWKIHDKDRMFDLRIEDADHSFSDSCNRENFMNFNINYRFCRFWRDRRTHWQKLFSPMLEVDINIFNLIGICLVEVNATDSIYYAYFLLFILATQYPFVCLFKVFSKIA